MYIEYKGKGTKLSEKKNAAIGPTAHAEDTAPKDSSLASEGEAKKPQSYNPAHSDDGGVSDVNINAKELKINEFDNLKKEENWDNEMLECIVEFGKR